jgi:hypothetical protein
MLKTKHCGRCSSYRKWGRSNKHWPIGRALIKVLGILRKVDKVAENTQAEDQQKQGHVAMQTRSRRDQTRMLGKGLEKQTADRASKALLFRCFFMLSHEQPTWLHRQKKQINNFTHLQ